MLSSDKGEEEGVVWRGCLERPPPGHYTTQTFGKRDILNNIQRETHLDTDPHRHTQTEAFSATRGHIFH